MNKSFTDELGTYYIVNFIVTNDFLKKYKSKKFKGKFYPKIEGVDNEWNENCFISDIENENIFHNGPFPLTSKYKFNCQKIYDTKEELIFLE